MYFMHIIINRIIEILLPELDFYLLRSLSRCQDAWPAMTRV